jgi:type 1 fimbria pilin
MSMSQKIRTCLIGAMAMLGATLSSAAHADSGYVRITVVKAGWFIGGAGGTGTLTFHGKVYPLTVGGLSAGLVFGASGTRFHGTVTNIYGPGDVAGVYGAANAGAALAVGVGAVVLTNEKGAVLHLAGHGVGLIADLDLSGMAIALR